MPDVLSGVPILIVTYGNVSDVETCLHAIRRLNIAPPPEVFICENGGQDAFARLLAALMGHAGPCEADPLPSGLSGARFSRVAQLRMKTADAVPGQGTIRVHVGCGIENLGYAGGVNAWLQPLLTVPGWRGVWVLNPDTDPDPDALAELIHYAERHGRGMVGSRLTSEIHPGLVHSRGLAWRRVRASTVAIGMHQPASIVLPPDEQDARLHSPSGASVYVTRDCLDVIGLMDERYFLYFEDLDWGLRARSACGGVGYAHRSIVSHQGGTTIGTSASRGRQSQLAVYLDFRNRLLFTRVHFPRWYLWTTLATMAHAALYLRFGAVRNMMAALQGVFAALRGQTGRPDRILAAHVAPTAAPDLARHVAPGVRPAS